MVLNELILQFTSETSAKQEDSIRQYSAEDVPIR